MARKIHTETHIQEPFLYVIVTDRDAGRPRRFTTYRLGLDGLKGATVIGRELPLGQSRKLR